MFNAPKGYDMQTATIHHSRQALEAAASPPAFIPLELETRPAVSTAAAAHYLNRQPQTLRGWASAQTHPAGLAPVRILGRLAWPVAAIKMLLGVA